MERGPQRRDRYLGTEHGGVRESAGREDGVPFREGRQVRGARAGTATVPSPSRRAEGQQGLPPTHTPARTGAAQEREGGGRAGVPEGGRAGKRGAQGGGPARAAAPAPARKGSRAAAAGVGGGPAPVLAELTGGARFPVPPGRWRPGRGAGGDGRVARGGAGTAAAAMGVGDWRALALPRRPLLSVCVCSKMAARLVPRDTDAGPPPPTPPRPRLPLPPRSRTPTLPPASPRRTAPRRPLPGSAPPRARHVTGCPCNLRLEEGGVPTSPALSWPSPASSREPAWVRELLPVGILESRPAASRTTGDLGPTPLLAPPLTASPTLESPEVSRDGSAPAHAQEERRGQENGGREGYEPTGSGLGTGMRVRSASPSSARFSGVLVPIISSLFFLSVAGSGVQSGRSASRTRAKGHRGSEKVGAETPGEGTT
ncbi:hypothetical protein LEMLEM_LOCUS20780 [Lemmus lemmus]